ncbi:hypothetical protein AMTRI_Chr04g189230 [Amborella trichopoda]
MQRPHIFNWKLSRLKEITEKVKELGIESLFKMYSHAVGFMSAMSKETWQRKFVFLKNFGWSEEDICTAFQKMPVISFLYQKRSCKRLWVILLMSLNMMRNICCFIHIYSVTV